MKHLQMILSSCSSMLGFVGIFLHALGIYLLTKPNTLPSNQKLYLINISAAEIAIQIFQTVMLNVMKYPPIYNELTMFQYYFNCLVWICILNLLTIDRFLAIFLNIKYNLYLTKKNTSRAIKTTWFFGGAAYITAVVLQKVLNYDSLKFLHQRLAPLFMILTIIIFSITYIYIYIKLLKINKYVGRSKNSENNNGNSNQINCNQRNRRHCIPFLIVFTFIIFIIIPEATVIALFYVYNFDKYASDWFPLILITHSLGFITDAAVYIFLHPSNRKRFLQLIPCKKNNNINQNNDRIFHLNENRQR